MIPLSIAWEAWVSRSDHGNLKWFDFTTGVNREPNALCLTIFVLNLLFDVEDFTIRLLGYRVCRIPVIVPDKVVGILEFVLLDGPVPVEILEDRNPALVRVSDIIDPPVGRLHRSRQ